MTLAWLAAAVLAAAAIVAVPQAYRTALVGSGFSAAILCGAVFVSGRDVDAVRGADLTGPGYELLRFFSTSVEQDKKRVTSSVYGFASQTAVFREGLGCTLIDGKTEETLHAQTPGLAPLPAPNLEALWPEGERVDLDAPAQGFDRTALNQAIDAAFAEPDPAHPRNTRVLIVAHRGRIVAERYAAGFDKNMPLIG